MEKDDSVRHRLICSGVPQRVPPFDSAFVNTAHRDGLKLLVKAAPESCQILTVTDGTSAAYAFKLLHKRNFNLRCTALELDLHTLEFSGRVAHLFVKGNFNYTKLSRWFCRGESMLHELSQSQGNVIDMFCFGKELHQALHQRNRGKSIVFVEE